MRKYLIPLLGARRGHIRAKAVWLLGIYIYILDFLKSKKNPLSNVYDSDRVLLVITIIEGGKKNMIN